MRSAFAEVLAAVPDGIAKGADLHRALQIDRKLSWKIFKVANASDPVTVGLHVPSHASMETFLKAARKRGVAEALLESVSRVAADFEGVVSSYAGDRATFDSMVSALAADEAAEQIDLVHRRLAFRGQRHVLGVYAKTQLKLVAMQPNQERKDWLDGIRVEGFVGLRRLRGDAPLVVSYSGARNDDGSPLLLQREPLEPCSGTHPMALLRDFCSKPLPELRAVEAGPGFMRGELVSQDVGKRAAVDCIEGHITRAAFPRYSVEGNRISGVVATVRTPSETLVLDLMVHKDTYGRLKPDGYVYAEHMGETNWDSVIQSRYRLPSSPAVKYLGRGVSSLHTSDVPRYVKLGRHVFKCAGWNDEEFDVYRCRVEYPLMPSSAMIRFDLPAAP